MNLTTEKFLLSMGVAPDALQSVANNLDEAKLVRFLNEVSADANCILGIYEALRQNQDDSRDMVTAVMEKLKDHDLDVSE